LEGFGRRTIKDQTRQDDRIFLSKQESRRQTGKPTLTWPEDVENDLRELKENKGRQETITAEEWASLVKGIRALGGP
jgi:hypothetical protein